MLAWLVISEGKVLSAGGEVSLQKDVAARQLKESQAQQAEVQRKKRDRDALWQEFDDLHSDPTAAGSDESQHVADIKKQLEDVDEKWKNLVAGNYQLLIFIIVRKFS